ncbi:hypothetical protein LTR35_013801 [Friedmanniomyces endolithicus]|nr:hypothetical protein LTR35_013801 [Friedmanniomyces endolithicus]KAK0277043.1 hypothetical protein LTS00_014319 [Friedmanniomyces endolithicus]KAK1010480.1 hypothetical protein LTR54_005435 [Friedmanniomyces endolithicus]
MAPPSGRRRILPFRVPFFRIFYSTTYTLLYIFTLAMLLITPASMIYSAVEAYAFQYIFMIGGVYILLADSRLYTNRTVLVGVGKAYLPIEKGEVGKQVRKMIVKQMERSAIVAWESRPRDLYGEILAAEKEGLLPPEAGGVGRNDYTLGRIIQIDPARPPWRIVRHPGWSSPSQRDDNQYPNVQFSDVIAELPNLIEARAVSLAPADPTMTPRDGRSIADPAVADLLTRPATMAMRDYITQLSYLGLMNPPETAQTFLRQYEHARFCGRPCTEDEFAKLMATFSDLLAGMVGLEPAIIEQIRAQTGEDAASMSSAEADPLENRAQLRSGSTAAYRTPSPVPAHSPASSVLRSPVTAREALSCDITPFATHQHGPSGESFGSVIHYAPNPAEDEVSRQRTARSSSLGSASMVSFASDAGSVIRHSAG